MDVDLESVEIVFAQKLASGEPTVRAHALRELHKWLKQQSAKKPFEEEDLTRLCKGLHYVMWMQDKMILQEEMADSIAGLFNIFENIDEKARYIKCSLKSISKEWPHIDKWRMDKFLMMMRRIIRVTFAYLASNSWEKSITEKIWAAFKETVMSNDKSFHDAIKYHFASLFLDELDLAGNISDSRVTDLIGTFTEMLTTNISDYIFSSVIDEIFKTILHAVSDEMVKDEDEGEEEEEDEGEEEEEEEEDDDDDEEEGATKGDEDMEKSEGEGSNGIKFDYVAIGKLLFEVGKRPDVKSKRRGRLYEMSKKFDRAAKGLDPFGEPAVDTIKRAVSKREFNNAVQKAVSAELRKRKGKESGRRLRKSMKRTNEAFLTGALPDIEKSSFTPSEKKFKLGDKKKNTDKGKKSGGKGQKSANGAKRKGKVAKTKTSLKNYAGPVGDKGPKKAGGGGKVGKKGRK